MSAEDFFDTNVLVYMLDETDPSKHRRAESIVHLGNYSGTACISYQVVQETMSVVTRKLGWPTEAARRLLDEILIPLWQVNPTPALYRRALSLQGQYSFSLYASSLIVSCRASRRAVFGSTPRTCRTCQQPWSFTLSRLLPPQPLSSANLRWR